MIGKLRTLGYDIKKSRRLGSRSWVIPVDIAPPEHSREPEEMEAPTKGSEV
jgi:hypothetical protein